MMSRFLLILIVALSFAIVPQHSSGQDVPTDIIEPADVFVAVDLVRQEIESIRFVMGKPKNIQAELNTTGAAPREVYFQTLTMFRKSDRLSFEFTRVHSEEPALPTGPIQASDVFNIVNLALEKVRQVKQELGIDTRTQPLPRDASKKPNDVFKAAVQANRELNLLLDRRFSPSDVFQQVTVGVGYSSRLLESFPDATTIPDEPVLEEGKRPSDVYRRLVDNFARIRTIARASGIDMLELNVDEDGFISAEPSDVYDIASLLVSELAYLHSKLANAEPPRDVYYFGRKFPSQVYQRAGILEQQLIELEKLTEENPGWLGKKK